MEQEVRINYASIGGNRHPSAADWSPNLGGCLVYGAGNSIALWRPSVRRSSLGINLVIDN